MNHCFIVSAAATLIVTAGCKPSDILSVPPPAGVTGASGLAGQSGAEQVLAGAKASVFQSIAAPYQLLNWTELLTDEFTWSEFDGSPYNANIDARITTEQRGFQEEGDYPLEELLSARSEALGAIPGLAKYEPAASQSTIGQAYALAGYTELFLAESYCAGVPLSYAVAGGGIAYGTPLTTDSLLGTAEVHFDSALAEAHGNDTVQALASVGLARTRLDRGHYADAATAVAAVPTSFIYNVEMPPSADDNEGYTNIYASETDPSSTYPGCGFLNVSNQEGENGLNFVSAHDPRLVLDSTISATCDGGTFYYPIKFGNPSTYIPLATGVEARLIEAEAAFQANQGSTWATDLSALRADSADTHVVFDTSQVPIKVDSTTGASTVAQASFLFRERAFWLFGTGTRLGDLRRLIRQYGRDQSTVFPTGPYANGHNPNLPIPLPTYSTDVNLTLPTQAGGSTTTNPNYKGCITSTQTA